MHLIFCLKTAKRLLVDLDGTVDFTNEEVGGVESDGSCR